MKPFLRMAAAACALSAAFSTSAPVFAGPLDPYMMTQLSEIADSVKATNESVKEMNMRLEQVLKRLDQQDQSTENGTCWLDGKAYSQGAEATVSGHTATCSVQLKTGWPQWLSSAGDVKGVSVQK